MPITLASAALCETPAERLGFADYRAGQYAQAVDQFSKALATEFNDPTVHYYLGSSYQYLRQQESAVREFRIAYALQPDGEIGRYAKQALEKMGAAADRVPTSADSLFVKLPRQQLDPAVAAKLDPKALLAMQAQMPLIMPTGPNLPNPPALPGGRPPHSSALPALETNWRVGQKFSSANLPDAAQDGPWFPITDWFAGTWQESLNTLVPTFRTEYVSQSPELDSHRCPQPASWGVVRDRTGVIWEHPLLPIIRQQLVRGQNVVEILVDVKPISADANLLRLGFHWVTLVIGSDQRIKTAVQSEQISAYVPVETNYCQETESVREYDEVGQPIRHYQYRTYLKRVHPPSLPVITGGNDFLRLFRQYCAAHHLTDQMP